MTQKLKGQRRETDEYWLEEQATIEAVALIRLLRDDPTIPWTPIGLVLQWVREAVARPWPDDLLRQVLDEIEVANEAHEDEPWEEGWWKSAPEVAAEMGPARDEPGKMDREVQTSGRDAGAGITGRTGPQRPPRLLRR